MKNFHEKVHDYISNWELWYSGQFIKDGFIDEYCYVDFDASRQEQRIARDNFLVMQISYIKYLVSSMMLDSETQANLRKIQQFLRRQLPAKMTDRVYHIQFWGGCYPYGAIALADELEDIDFADSLAFIRYQLICISTTLWNRWTKKRMAEVIDHIKDDLEFDGLYADIGVESHKSELTLGVRIIK